VFSRGGFDAVVGNPPYGASFTRQENIYLSSHFDLQEYQLDSYILFVERSLTLVRRDGFVGVIIPNTWLLNLLSPQIRVILFEKAKIDRIVHYQNKVFEDATVDTEIVIFSNSKLPEGHLIEIEVSDKRKITTKHSIPQERWIQGKGKPVNIFQKVEYTNIADKMKSCDELDKQYLVTQGTKPFQVGKGKPPQTRKIVDEKPFVSEIKKDSTFRPLLRGSLIQKYQTRWNKDYWISFGDWLAEPRYSAKFDAIEKITIRQTGDSLIATLDNNQFIVRDNLYTIVSRKNDNLRFLLALLNSKLLNWFYQNIVNPEKGEALAQVKRGHLALLPIRAIDFSNPIDVKRHDRMVALVERMLELHKRTLVTPQEQERLTREIQSTDREIDRLVYELYGLAEEEIKIVEGE
jgi:adenine-specific DNA-methyltransferase